MLEDLKHRLDKIEAASDWEYRFVTDIMERVESNTGYKLSGKQFEKLADIHFKYCGA